MGKVSWIAEVVQGVIAIALIAAYVTLVAMGKPADHLDLGIVAVMGTFFGGKVSQTVMSEVRDLLGHVKITPPTAEATASTTVAEPSHP